MATAFQSNAFQQAPAFQIDAAAGVITGIIVQTTGSATQAATGTVTGGITPEPPGRVGGGFANWSPALDKKRRKAWKEANRARRALRASLERLFRGEPDEEPTARTEVLEAVSALAEARRELSMPELADFRREIQHVEAAVLRALAGDRLRQAQQIQLEAQLAAIEAERLRVLEAFRQEEEAIVALLA